jgi:hypothetical protein
MLCSIHYKYKQKQNLLDWLSKSSLLYMRYLLNKLLNTADTALVPEVVAFRQGRLTDIRPLEEMRFVKGGGGGVQ